MAELSMMRVDRLRQEVADRASNPRSLYHGWGVIPDAFDPDKRGMAYGLYLHLLQMAAVDLKMENRYLTQAIQLPWTQIEHGDPPDYDLLSEDGVLHVPAKRLHMFNVPGQIMDLLNWKATFDNSCVDVLTGSVADLLAARDQSLDQSQILPYMDYRISYYRVSSRAPTEAVTICYRLVRALAISRHDWGMVLRHKLSEYLGYSLGDVCLMLNPHVPDCALPSVDTAADLSDLGLSFKMQRVRSPSLTSDPSVHWE